MSMQDDKQSTLLWVIQQRDLIQMAWKRALSAPTESVRARWVRCAKTLEQALDEYLKARRAMFDLIEHSPAVTAANAPANDVKERAPATTSSKKPEDNLVEP